MTVFVILLALFSSAGAVPLDSLHPFEVVRKAESRNPLPLAWLDADSSHNYDMTSLSLDYRVESTAGSVLFGIASITLRAVVPLAEIKLNAEGLTIYSVSEGAQNLPYTHNSDTLIVQRAMSAGDMCQIDVQLTAPAVELFMETGYHVDWQRVFTFSEPFGARRWIPCYDQPFDKFDSVKIAVNMPEAWSLAANGSLISTTYPEAGRKREVYQHKHPISTYLVSIVAGLHSKWSETRNGVTYRYFTFPQDSAKAAHDWEHTPQMLEFFETRFGDYPFEEYGMAEASIQNGWGAMEHQTMTSYGWRLIDSLRTFEQVVAHELAHQWFGDHLGPLDFRDIWLNEGFATYSAVIWVEHLYGDSSLQTDFRNMINGYFAEDDEIRYAIYDPPPEKLFGSAVYVKGAAILHMLRVLMGDEVFFQGMRNYVAAYGGGSVTTTEFRDKMAQAYGQSLDWFFDQWVFQAGHPELKITITNGSPSAEQVQVHVLQTQENAPIFKIPISIDVKTVTDSFTVQSWFESADQTNTLSFPGLISAQLSDFQPLIYEASGSSQPAIPETFFVGAAYPNPFNATTTIPIDLPKRSRVRADLYDLTGRFLRTVAFDIMEAGRHDINITADSKYGSGIYFVNITSGFAEKTSKIVLLK